MQHTRTIFKPGPKRNGFETRYTSVRRLVISVEINIKISFVGYLMEKFRSRLA
jgi:hypothetical protein